MGRPRKKRKYTFRTDRTINRKTATENGDGTVNIRAEELREVILLARTAARRMEDILFEATGR